MRTRSMIVLVFFVGAVLLTGCEKGPAQKAGEKIDRAEFDAMLSRFYEIANLTDEGIPKSPWRETLERTLDNA